MRMRVSLILIAFGSAFLLPLACEGQVAAARLGRMQDAQQRVVDSIKWAIAEHESECSFSLNSCIQEISRVCNVSESQRKKLRIAAKGTTKRVLRKFAEDRVKQFEGSRLNLKLNVDEILDEIKKDDGKGDQRPPVRNIATVFRGFGQKEIDISKDPFWKKAVQKTLNEGQLKLLSESRSSRAKFRRNAAIAAQVSEIDSILRLSEAQRVKLAKVLEREMGEELEKFGLELSPRMFSANETESPIDQKVVKEFLSEQQMVAWKERVEPRLMMIKSAGQPGNGRQVRGIRALPAVRAVRGFQLQPAVPMNAIDQKKKDKKQEKRDK